MSDPILIAAAIALLVSINFGVASHVQHIALDHMDVQAGTLVNIGTTAFIFAALSPLYLVPETLWTHSAMLFALAGLIVPALSITMTTLSVKMIGPGLTSGIASTSPVFATIIAVVFLGEIATLPIIAGTFVVMTGIMLIAFRSKRGGVSWPLWALGLPLIAALTRGISHPVIKVGLDGLPDGIDGPMLAALVSSSVSLVVLSLMFLFSGRSLPAWNPGYLWFALSGVVNGIGIYGLSMALGIGKVIVVSPIIATTPAFTLLMGYFIFRRETITWSSIFAIALIFLGVMLIIMT